MERPELIHVAGAAGAGGPKSRRDVADGDHVEETGQNRRVLNVGDVEEVTGKDVALAFLRADAPPLEIALGVALARGGAHDVAALSTAHQADLSEAHNAPYIYG